MSFSSCDMNDYTDEPAEEVDYDISETVNNSEEIHEVLDNLKQDDKAIIILEPGRYEEGIEIHDEHQFSELTITAEEELEATITEGIKIINNDNITISGLKLIHEESQKEVGIGVWYSENIQLKHNFIEGFDKWGLYVTSYSDGEEIEPDGASFNTDIIGNEVKNESKGGIHIQGFETKANLENNYINHCSRGVWIDRGAEAVIKNNEFNENIISLYLTEIDQNNFIAENNNFFAGEFDIDEIWLKNADIGRNLETAEYLYVMADRKGMDEIIKKIKDENNIVHTSDLANINLYEHYYELDFESHGVILASKDIEIEKGIFEVKSRPEQGFHWNYFIYIPETFDRDDRADHADHMLMIPNYPEISDDPEVINDEAQEDIERFQHVSETLGVPLLVPAFPRPETIKGSPEDAPNHFTSRLDRNTLSLHLHDGVKEKYHRIDKQVDAIIDHSLDIFAKNDIQLSEQVFIYGYSATAHFANRFIKLHPERVQASVSGGIAVITLPEYHKNKVDLNFPVGVYDLDVLADTQFDKNSYQDIPQFIFRGKEDYGDDDNKVEPLAATNTIDDTEREKYEKALETKAMGRELWGTEEAKEIMIERMITVEEVYNKNNVPAQFKLYEGVGHRMTNEIWDDVIEFFKKNADNRLDEI